MKNPTRIRVGRPLAKGTAPLGAVQKTDGRLLLYMVNKLPPNVRHLSVFDGDAQFAEPTSTVILNDQTQRLNNPRFPCAD